ncbi:hypothetical protein FQR65_LT17072 [Abscondita terminalis]|nr:hypothetical protein FQR65_LT17072 [Abscondita terminalis]
MLSTLYESVPDFTPDEGITDDSFLLLDEEMINQLIFKHKFTEYKRKMEVTIEDINNSKCSLASPCPTIVSTCSGPSTSIIGSSPGCLMYEPDEELMLSLLPEEDITFKPPEEKKRRTSIFTNLELDFNIMYPDKANIIYETWAKVADAILSEAKERKIDLPVSIDRSTQALLILPFSFTPVTLKIDKKDPNQNWRPTRTEIQRSFYFQVKKVTRIINVPKLTVFANLNSFKKHLKFHDEKINTAKFENVVSNVIKPNKIVTHSFGFVEGSGECYKSLGKSNQWDILKNNFNKFCDKLKNNSLSLVTQLYSDSSLNRKNVQTIVDSVTHLLDEPVTIFENNLLNMVSDKLDDAEKQK